LLDNAIRYTPNNGKVTTNIYLSLADMYLIVEDNGLGIPEEELELIFERFYRGSQTKTFGTGLGLSIVKEIAALHDATVEVESKTGKVSGTQFKVRFNRLIET
jgi:signal transduction histidine kinase